MDNTQRPGNKTDRADSVEVSVRVELRTVNTSAVQEPRSEFCNTRHLA